MTIFNDVIHNVRESVEMYFGESEANDPAYNLELLAWSAVLAVPQAVRTEEEAHELAIQWQDWQSEQALSIGELAEWSSYFTEVGEKFNLTDEFRENGII